MKDRPHVGSALAASGADEPIFDVGETHIGSAQFSPLIVIEWLQLFARRRNRCPVLVAPKSITASTSRGRREPITLAKLLSYWNRRAGGLPGVTRGRCSRLDRQGDNKQRTENSNQDTANA